MLLLWLLLLLLILLGNLRQGPIEGREEVVIVVAHRLAQQRQLPIELLAGRLKCLRPLLEGPLHGDDLCEGALLVGHQRVGLSSQGLHATLAGRLPRVGHDQLAEQFADEEVVAIEAAH